MYVVEFLGLEIQVGRLQRDVRSLKREFARDQATKPIINCNSISYDPPQDVSQEDRENLLHGVSKVEVVDRQLELVAKV